MKKLLALMVALLMVFGLASFAAAEVEINGDARVRGTLKSNPNYDSDDDSGDTRWYDSRIRLKVHGSNDDGAGVKMRLTMRERTWDGQASSGSTTTTKRDNGPDGLPGTADDIFTSTTTSAENIVRYDKDDYAYMYLSVAENWELSAGFMPGVWGHKFWGCCSAQARLKLHGKMDPMTLTFWTQKNTESDGAVDINGDLVGDFDERAVEFTTKAGEFDIGAILVMGTNDVPASSESGNMFDVYFTGKAGDISLKGEIAQEGGDLYESPQGDSKFGVFVGAGMDMDGLKLSGTVAMTSNGYTANKYFTPSALIGTSQPTALFNLGECGVSGGQICDTTAIVLGVDTKLSDEMGVGATIVYAMLDGYSDELIEGTWLELDAKFSYSLGEKTKYSAVLGYGSPTFDYDGADMSLDSAFSINHKIGISF